MWTVPDALLAAVLAVGLASVLVRSGARSAVLRAAAVPVSLVVALATTLLLHGRPPAEILVAAVAAVVALLRLRRVARPHNDVARSDRRC